MIRELDTSRLRLLEREAYARDFSQRLPETWIELHVNADRFHAAQVVLKVDAQAVPPRPPHWRLLLLLNMRDGRVAVSLLDVMPESFLDCSREVLGEQERQLEDAMDQAPSVAEWEAALDT